MVDLAAVYSREIDGQTLTIIPSGWTYESTFVLYDKESGSLWYPYKNGLLAIQGKYFKKILQRLSIPEVKEKLNNTNYFRKYGFSNQYEFLAVIAEYFFESPNEFKSQFPIIYGYTQKLLNFKYSRY